VGKKAEHNSTIADYIPHQKRLFYNWLESVMRQPEKGLMYRQIPLEQRMPPRSSPSEMMMVFAEPIRIVPSTKNQLRLPEMSSVCVDHSYIAVNPPMDERVKPRLISCEKYVLAFGTKNFGAVVSECVSGLLIH